MSRQTSLPLASIALLAAIGTFESLRAQELFPQVNPPLLVPESKDPQSSPFSDDAESLKAPEKSNEAKNSAGSLNNLFSHQWVQTNGTGGIKGSVVTLSGDDTLSVSGTRVILAQQGRSIANTSSNQDGEFSFENVSPGYYSIIAEADNSFATYGLAVLSNDAGSHLPNSIEIRVIRPKGDAIRKIIGTELPPTAISGTNDSMVSDPLAPKRSFAKSHRILSSVDGKVVGRLSTMGMAPELVDMSQMKTMLLLDGIEIGRSNVMVDGSFSFENVEPGCYGLVAAGNRGVAAVAFCVLKPSESSAMQKSSDGKVYVMANGTLQDTASSSLNVELADGNDVMNVQEQVKADKDKLADDDSPFVAPTIVGNGPGAGQVIGGGGGGGLGGGLGGLGGIGGLGALAAVAALVADDDDDNNNTVVSPITTTTAN
jgi:Carboxypeptidase regulatory-like domain